MKILHIKFKNINSLKGEHHINFEAEPLQTNSLFAITGPTGSGKSTLLDVICLALFNQIPRMNRVSKTELVKTGAVITRHQKEAFAEVVYSSAAGKFLSHWDIEYNRNNNLNDYEMRIKDLIQDRELDLKKSDVPSKNEELIGLNYPQFIKSILLAQGEFAKFLQAKDSDRKQILEQITGTEIYRKLGMLAFEKARIVQNEIKENKRRIEDLKQQQWDIEELTAREEELKKQEKQKSEAVATKEKLNQQQQLLVEKNRLTKAIEKAKEEEEKAKKALQAFALQHELRMKNHLKTQSFAEDLQQWKTRGEEVKKMKKQGEALAEQFTWLEKEQNQLFAKIVKLLPEEPQSHQVNEALEAFRVEVNQLTQKLNDTKTAYTHIFNPLKEKLNQLEIDYRRKSTQVLQEAIQEKSSDFNEEEKQLKKDLQQFEQQFGNLNATEINHLVEKANEAKLLEPILAKQFAQKKELGKRIIHTQDKLQGLPEGIKSKTQELKTIALQLENVQLKQQNQLLVASLEEQRHHLEEGKPCPLCGAIEHPYANQLPDLDDDMDEQIKKLKANLSAIEKERDKLKNLHIQLSSTLQNDEKQLASLKQDIHLNQEKWDSDYAQMNLDKAETTWESYINGLKAYRKAQENQQILQDRKELLKKVDAVLVQLSELELKGKKVKAELEKVFSGKDIDALVNKLKTNWDRLSEKLDSKKNQLATHQKEEKQLVRDFELFSKQLQIKVNSNGFESIKESMEARLSEQNFQDLQTKRNNLQNEIGGIQNKSKLLEHDLEAIKKKTPNSTLEEVEEKITNLNLEIKHTEQVCKELFSAISEQKKYVQRISELRNSIKQAQKNNTYWLLMDELIGDKTGKKFNDFAQDLSLQHLLSIANKRLLKLNDRYQLDKPSSKEGEDLVVVDFDMGNERRSVRTLSGGETFVISLALALSLSDLASQNVQIHSMFIDEGFGTLDAETLDQTLDTLERLQAESNKTIGIISHVEALKERIQTQIKLTKNGQGYSSLEVV